MGIKVEKVAVLGANGRMGSLSGGIFAQAGLQVFFLSRSEEKSRKGVAAAVQQARSEEIAERIVSMSYERLEEVLSSSDWIFEAVGEDLSLKKEFYKKIDQYRRPHSIVSTVSSGLSIKKLAEGKSESFRKHFLGTHFYNPPGKLPAAERISHPETDPKVIQFVDDFMTKNLRRIVIPTLDTPAFAGNRIGFQLLNKVAMLAEKIGVERVDYLIGPYTGRAMSPLVTIDLVGLDVHKAIVDNIYQNTKDERHETFRLPGYMAEMVQEGQLGDKTPDKGGFYKQGENKKRLVLDVLKGEYRPLEKMRIPFIEKAKELIHIGEYRKAFEILKDAKEEEADIVRRTLAGYVSYAFNRVGEVTPVSDGMRGIDAVMGHGFNWAPPSSIIDFLGGPKAALELIERYQLPIPSYLEKQAAHKKVARLYSDMNVGRYFIAA
jgi:3-hydroxyacyl-CoA dehydrogenase